MNRPLLLFLTGCFAVAQAVGQPCPQYARLMEAGEKFQTAKKYEEALNKFNAAKLCDPAKTQEVDARVKELFGAIEAEKLGAEKARDAAEKARQQAVAARKQAEAATKQATEANADARRKTKQSMALYWALGSDNMEPGKAVGLLMKADQQAPYSRPIQERLVRRRNELPSFSEKSRLNSTNNFYPRTTFSPDGQKLLVSSFSEPPTLWDVFRPDEPEAVFSPADYTTSSTFSPDGRRVLATSAQGLIRVWDVQRPQEPLATLHAGGRVESAFFSPDGRWVLHASADSTAKLWAVAAPEKPVAVFRHDSQVISAEFSPDGRRVFTVSSRRVRVWDVARPDNPLVDFSAVHEIFSGTFSPSRRYVALQTRIPSAGGVSNDSLRVYDFESFSRKPIAVLPANTLIQFFQRGLQYQYDQLLAVAKYGTEVSYWRLERPTWPPAVIKVTEPIRFVSVSPDFQWFLLAHQDAVHVYKGNDVKNKPVMVLPCDHPFSALLSPDGGKVLTMSEFGASLSRLPIRLWYLTPETAREWLRANPRAIVPLSDEEIMQYSVFEF